MPRRPKPTALKVIAGNPGHRPLNVAEPKPDRSSGRAPRGLGEEGSKFWRKYAKALAALDILTEIDEPALRMAAEHYEIAVRAAEQLRTAVLVEGKDGQVTEVVPGLLVRGSDGPKKNPLIQILRDNSAALKGYLVEFGMTPAARSRLKPGGDDQLSLGDLFAKVAELTQGEAAEVDPLQEFREGDDGG